MQRDYFGSTITRRRFSFWLGLGIFSLGEKLHANSLDEVAAALMRSTEEPANAPSAPEHWRAADNQTWRWHERETLIDGEWRVTGITTPVNKATGELYSGRRGYLDRSLVPADLRRDDRGDEDEETKLAEALNDPPGPPRPDPARKARHGRPPSKWLRSLRANEIRIWLKTIDVPEAGVSGMTYWTHLTRDHSFAPEKIAGLMEDEQAKLHAAAHFGY